MKLKTKLCKNKILPWFSTLQLSTQQKNKKKLLNRKIEIENEVTENEIKNEIYVKTKYWHECWHCSCWHE